MRSRAPSRRALAAVGLALAACAREPAAPGADAPPALAASLAGEYPEVAARAEQARAALRAAPEDAGAWGELGLVLEANYLPALAVSAYAEAARRAPDAFRWRYRSGVAREACGDLEGARADFEAALALDASTAPPHWRLGMLLLELGRLDDARDAFRRALRRDERDPAGWAGLARCAMQADDATAALESLERALALQPADAYLLGLRARALRQASRAAEAEEPAPETGAMPDWRDPFSGELERRRAPTAIARRERAVEQASADRPEKAVATLEALAAETPDEPGLLHKLALAYAAAGRTDDALRTLRRTLALEPDQRAALVDLGLLLLRQGSLAEAAVPLERARALPPGDARAHAAWAELLEARGDLDGALLAFEEALRLDQRGPDLFVRSGLLQLVRRQTDDARARFERALEIDPRCASARLGLALAALERGERDAARAEVARLPPEARRGPLWRRVRKALER